ncbi:hypothetical protein AWE51_23055 [Aquimarina aggregata]|uniref:Uncharacterized protein n=2 Tax=Aquimarina aggregata TaxID=1642818 RepID=A0A162FCP2_9FLAO|nr:hypothetical protein AWE51_23055 [Aquimarina aggregata]
MFIVTTITYLNHFDNSFHFDDFHTITENPNIKSLKNIPSFFTDGRTISSLPQNQTYRPIVTTSLAIDYWLGGGYKVFYFHLVSFILFLLLGVLIFFFTLKILDLTFYNNHNYYIAAGITLWYVLHPVMAETVNYIIARSDLQSTFFVVLAFVIYQHSSTAQKYHLYLIPVAIGTLSKPTTIMFAPLLVCYVFIFEEKMSFLTLFSKKHLNTFIKMAKKVAPSVLFCSLLFVFHHMMTPETFSTGSSKTYNYLITQPYVVSYYFGSIFFPIHLSADTDWTMLESIWSFKFLIGFLVLLALIVIAIFSSKTKKYAPISFGILWFLIALAPTSSIIPLAEVMNDHRMFFPYVGLIISTGYTIGLVLQYLKEKYQLINIHIITCTAIILSIYAFGTYQRNKVWHNEESLWKDVTIKSPKNGRGLMNYGLTLMAKGDYDTAESYFKSALKLLPYYHSLYINLGILNNAKGNASEAEKHFKSAIKHGANFYTSWFYYGRFLSQKGRANEAITKLSKATELSPFHMETRYLLMDNYLTIEDWSSLKKIAVSTLKIDESDTKSQIFLQSSIDKKSALETEEAAISKNPTAEKYLDLSLKYYQKKHYKKSIEIANKVIAIKPNSHEAYNNICTAYNLLGEYKKAIEACNKAILLIPNFNLAKNNLNYAITRNTKITELTSLLEKDQNEGNYLNLGLLYFNFGHYQKCIEITKKGIISHPNSDNLYNNMCAAYNSLKNWDKAIEAGKQGLTINPNNELLKNNYNWAIKNKGN